MKRHVIECDCNGSASGAITSPGVVRDVKVLGMESRNAGDGGNGRRYTNEALRQGMGLYEGASVYIDHNKLAAVRPLIEKFGVLRNVHLVEGDGLRGDLHYNPEHPYSKLFQGWVATLPEEVGFSHSAIVGSHVDAAGVEVVEAIYEVKSVDIVSKPATTKGVFEAYEMDESDLLTPTTGGDTAPESEEVKHYREHLADMVAAIIKDESINPDEKLAKIKAALKIEDAGSDSDTETPVVEDMEEDEGDETPVTEDKKDKKADAEESLADGIARHVNDAVAKALARVDGLVAKKLEEAFGTAKKATAKPPVSTASGKTSYTKETLLSELAGVI